MEVDCPKCGHAIKECICRQNDSKRKAIESRKQREAMTEQAREYGGCPANPVVGPDGCQFSGLTTREWLAGMAMQGILAHPRTDNTSSEIANVAFAMADAMADAMIERSLQDG